MAGKYAADTSVPVSKSRDEIERTLARFGATAFAYFSNSIGQVAISFEIHHLRVEMQMMLPSKGDYDQSPTGRQRTAATAEAEWEKACRQRWRSLANGIKAKLALVDDGISTVEREFLADVVTPDGQTVGQKILPELRAIARGGEVPPLMPTVRVTARVIELSSGNGDR